MRRMEAVTAARECLGTKFVHQGRLCGSGLDCIGLIVHVAKRLQIPHTDSISYGRRPGGGRLERALEVTGNWIPLDQAGVGDVLLFWILRPDLPQHVAILTAKDRMIHTNASVGRVVEHQLSEPWTSRISRAWRYFVEWED